MPTDPRGSHGQRISAMEGDLKSISGMLTQLVAAQGVSTPPETAVVTPSAPVKATKKVAQPTAAQGVATSAAPQRHNPAAPKAVTPVTYAFSPGYTNKKSGLYVESPQLEIYGNHAPMSFSANKLASALAIFGNAGIMAEIVAYHAENPA